MRKNIKIENPVAGVGWTSRQRAKRFVSKGVAEWVKPGETIRFRRDNHQTRSIQRVLDETARGYDSESRTGLATIEDIRNLPVVGRMAGAVRLVTLRTHRTQKAT